jgi:predicted Ser/Thr protein kinase
MGVVYLAQAADGALVALKVMHPAWVAERGFPQRFEREVEAIRRVAPFCTAPVLDHAVTEDHAYIVTEYVEGRTLWDTVQEDGPLSGARLESVAVGMAVALTAVHRAGIVHRDLKPGNVILSPEGARVIDFGIAKLAGAGPITGNVAMGTPPFMAPEQAAGQEVTQAADVFSWGAVVTYAGTGTPPFGRGPSAAVFYRLMHQQPDLGDLGARLRPLVAAALDKRPENRPSARELVDELAGRPLAESAAADLLRSGWQRATVPDGPRTEPAITRHAPAQVPVSPPRRGRIPGGRGVLWVTALAGVSLALAWTALYEAFGPGDDKEGPPRPDFHDTFDGQGKWPRAATEVGTARYFGGGYLLQPLPEQGMAATAPVKTNEMGAVRVTANARMQGGPGQYGIWCAGNPVTDAQSRYSFFLTSDGNAGIFKEGRNGARWELVPFRATTGVVPDGENRIDAECRFTPQGTVLRMQVNGHEAAGVRDRTRAYGPGAVGVGAISAAGANTAATARYESFTVRRLPE